MAYEDDFARIVSLIRPLWQAALLTPVDDDTDLFDLGADSLLALTVMTEINRLGYDLPRTAVFDHPTLNRLAVALLDSRPGVAA
ncbi:acyl carrier protein [Micromonosporaceae bacterium Da 78-11]